MRKKKRIFIWIAMLVWSVFLLTGCGQTKDEESAKDLDYTIVEKEDIPEELSAKMEENKENGFKLSYLTEDYLYIARGYGAQETGGYSVIVKMLKSAEEAIGFETELIGPENGEKVSQAVTYPYIVVKTERLEQNVVFK